MMIYQNSFLTIFYKKNLFFANNFGIGFINILFIDKDFNINVYLDRFSITSNFVYSFNFIFNFIHMKYSFYKRLNVVLSILKKFYIQKLSLYGVGFRSWIYMNKQKLHFLLLKVGFSFDLCYFIFSNIKFLCLKPNLILLKSLNKQKTNQVAATLCNIKNWNLYKNKGIFYFDKKIVTKSVKNK